MSDNTFGHGANVYVTTIVPDETGKATVVAIADVYLHTKVQAVGGSWNHTIIPWSNIAHIGWSEPRDDR